MNVTQNGIIILAAEIILGIAIFAPGIDPSTKSGAVGALAGSLGTRLALPTGAAG